MIYSEKIVIDSLNSILLEVLDARSIRLTLKVTSYNVCYESPKRINSIHINGHPYVNIYDMNSVYVKIGEKIQKYEITEILYLKPNVFQLNTQKRTKSSYFLNPLIFKSKEDMRWGQYYVNSYIVDLETEPKLALEYRFFPIENYLKFETEIQKSKNYHSKIELDSCHVAFLFKFEEFLYDDIQKFLEGAYSELSGLTKNAILRFHKSNTESKIYNILYKTNKLRKQLELEFECTIDDSLELYEIPNVSEEMLILPTE